MARQYNDPLGGTPSSIGNQLRTDKFDKKALIEAAKEQYFSPLASTRQMPKHMGKKIVQYHYLPILDDANVNDQGIDANGATINQKATIIIRRPGQVENIYMDIYGVGEGATSALAQTAAEADAVNHFKNLGLFDTDYATTVANITALADPWTVITSATTVPVTGNLYGSSKDVGTIASKLPVVGESGGRVNRVGHKRIEIEGTFEKFGFFDEYTAESLYFDSDAELEMHIRSENMKAANEITEDALQIDLLSSAGVVRYAGVATSTSELTGEAGIVSEVTYNDFQKVSIDLDNNRCPKHTTMMTGTRMVDTQTIDSARIMYIGTDLQPTVEGIVDQFGNAAFTSREKYAAGTKIMRGEIGSLYQFRIVVVPEMQRWEGAGATVVANTGYRETDGRYDVFPMLVVGDKSFTTIGFQTAGKGNKFKIKHSKPGDNISYSKDDPYGQKGFHSILWYYGFMLLRPERIALIKTVAKQ